METHIEDDVEVDTQSHMIPDTEDVVEADTSSGAPSDPPSGSIFDMEADTELDAPLPAASELGLVDLYLKAGSEAETYTKLAVPKNLTIATYLHQALDSFGEWACRTMELAYERLAFLETLDDSRARTIVRFMRNELDGISRVISELLDLEEEAANSAAGGDAAARDESLIEQDMARCREEVMDITLLLSDLRNETDSYWPGRLQTRVR